MEDPPVNAPASALSRFVLRAALADPAHLPELLANFAVHHLGQRAAASVARAREEHPEAGDAELSAMVIARGRRISQSEGAFVGGPFTVLVPFAFCTALLTQSRMMLELAAVTGREPTEGARAAELLVIQGVYGDERQAAAALEAAAAARPDAPPGRIAALLRVVKRMAHLLGVVTTEQRPVSTASRVGRWILLVGVLLIGLVAPLVWLPFLGYSYHRAGQELGERAWAYYRGEATARPSQPTRPVRAGPAQVAAALRTLLTLLLPIGAVLLVAATDATLAGSQYPLLAIVLVTLSTGVGTIWYLRRRHRRQAAD
ncbi:hypothetical protein PUR71_26025 [Streptomyces sp. SP17BM10]|uniref:hypothetical protein n=1 Tax=Streptomyces sp. SP17BM10 TaxID=3002530 RepID=UPI002E7830F1|nr:hypothetical protein [Streptomyces sp. SP17BM10]MEE1786334.1 hypothetical protein [Streptomyces sp. SP17BM10]